MPIGRPDWYAAGKSDNVATLDDLGELGVRLGAALAYDRTGKAFLIDTFERLDGHWQTASSGASGAAALNSTYADYGSNSVAMGLNAGASNYHRLFRYTRGWTGARLSLEAAFVGKGGHGDWQMNLIYGDGETQYNWGIYYDKSVQELQYQSGLAIYTAFQTLAYDPWDLAFFPTAKLDVDLSTGYYTRFRLDTESYDLSSYELYSRAFGSYPYLITSLRFYGATGGTLTWYLDRVILTEDL